MPITKVTIQYTCRICGGTGDTTVNPYQLNYPNSFMYSIQTASVIGWEKDLCTECIAARDAAFERRRVTSLN